MRHTHVKSVDELTKEYTNTLARYATIKKVVPVFRGELNKYEGKSFNIRAVNAITQAIKTAYPEIEAFGNKSTKYNGETAYYITVRYPTSNGFAHEEFDNKYSDEPTFFLQFSALLDRFNNVDQWITDTEMKLASLPERHAEASKRLDALSEYDDLID